MVKASLLLDLEQTETTDFKLLIHSHQYGLPNSGTQALSAEDLDLAQELAQVQALGLAQDGLISLASAEVDLQAVEEVQFHQYQTMVL